MSERVTMPALGESVTEGTVTRWLKSVGEEVAADEPLLEVSTDKVDTEVPSPVAGTLQKILVDEDETAEVGADLCIIGDGPADDDDSDDSDSQDEPEEADEDQADDEEDEADDDSQEEEPQEKPKAKSSGGGSGGEKVQMPALGESVTEGTVTRWLKEEGDDVEVDEPLLEVSTDKVDTEVPSPVAGKLTKILVAEDETAEVGADLCIIGGDEGGGDSDDEGDEEPQAQEEEPKKEEPKKDDSAKEESEDDSKKDESKDDSKKDESKDDAEKDEPKQESKESSKEESKDEASAYVTPLVRKLAADHGVDLGSLKGTGVGGRIRKQDVLDAAKAKEEPEPEQQPAAPPKDSAPAPVQAAPAPSDGPAKPTKVPEPDTTKRGTTEKMSRLRKIVAQRMVESLQTSAQLTAVVEVDMTRVAALRARSKEEFKAREGANLSFLPFICLATVEALKAFPALNSSIDGESIVYHGAEHLAIAVDTPRGLLVPVIKDAGDLNIAGLARKIADVAARTRSNKIGPDELSGGTFTVSNIGSAGSVSDTPIINQPQVGILGTGTIVKRPVVVKDADGNETIGIRSMMNLCLTYDHRVVDGADAGRFLTALKNRLEEGAFEL